MADAPGTCHLVGCPGKGQHPPHGIGAGKWDDYTTPTHCLGFPLIEPYDIGDTKRLVARCSVTEDGWDQILHTSVSPTDIAVLVDVHKRDCPNRAAR